MPNVDLAADRRRRRALMARDGTQINRALIDSWLWIARHSIRKRRPARAFEAMLSALWLMGVER